MSSLDQPSQNPRKMPRQDRAVVTVEAILEATTQVLLNDGPIRLNTTRIARRAGVSVGTLYQYFPNKQALLFAVLKRHLAELAGAIEAACVSENGSTLDRMAGAIVRAYLSVRMAQSELAYAIYLIASEIDSRELTATAMGCCEIAIQRALASASDGRFEDAATIARTLTAVLFGTVPVYCRRVLPVSAGKEAEKQLTLMFQSYLGASKSS